MAGIIYTIYAGMGLIKKRIKMLVIVFILNIIANFALSYQLGIYGTALTMGLTWLALFCYGYWDLRKEGIELKLDYSLLGKNIIVGVLALVGLNYLIGINGVNNLQTRELLLLNGLIFTGIIALTNLKIIKEAYYVVKQLRSLK